LFRIPSSRLLLASLFELNLLIQLD
jgi:hypothetical protein